ncbi:zinc ribbon domain-containing protein [Gilvimarinus gilvus]|uniref:zinc ribbon domain-containing protein n=1 Tax=Gilvimarinus gilvus TaxID=3058038 RepID=UPI0034A060AE
MHHRNWKCPKCKHTEFTTGEMRVAGGFWSKVFDIQGSKYSAVTCEKCSYTEFYKSSSSAIGSVFDFFTT